jgi:hypothetical protein
MNLLPQSVDDLIPSIALDALLAQRDAAVAQLRAIAGAVAAYHTIGETIWPETENGSHRSAWYAFREPVSQRPSGHGAYLEDAKFVAESTKAVDAAIWDHLLSESGLWTFFDSKARKEWQEQIEKRETPPLTADNIRATFQSLYAQRGTFFERGVVELFRGLSWDYKTNQPVAFGKRIIIRYLVGSYGSPGSAGDKIDDLDRAFHLLDGKPEPDHRSSVKSRLWHREPRNAPIDTPYIRLKTFQNGNGHVEFLRQDLVEELNRILAKHCPNTLARASSAEAA